jgi:hypothetical protein
MHSRLTPRRSAIEYGPWRAWLVDDELVDLRHDGLPVLRGIRAVVRDADWRTLESRIVGIGDTTPTSAADARVIRLETEYRGWGSSYRGIVTIRLTDDTVAVDFSGVADAAFRGNRIGLVVLHHPDAAGTPVTVTSQDGSRTLSAFPTRISPHQPFTDVAGLAWTQNGLDIAVRFSGDVFETEDQRNWTDASFKTYSTPLAAPFPVDHPRGSRVEQAVLVTASPTGSGEREVGGPAAAAPAAAPVVPGSATHVITVSTERAACVPALAVTATTDPATTDVATTDPAASEPAAAGRDNHPPIAPIPGLESLLVELEGTTDDRRRHLRRAAHEADGLGIPLDVRIVAADGAELAATLDLLEELPSSGVIRLAAYHSGSHVTEPALWSALTAEAASRGFTATLVAGTRAHFTELNRTEDRLPVDAAAVTFSITPQMHAREVDRIVETLPMQTLVARDALRLSSGRPLVVGPITLRPRFNAVATSSADAPDVTQAIRATLATDDLQHHGFAAAWLLGSIAALSAIVDGIASISLFELEGARGFHVRGEPSPAGRLLRAIAGVRGADVLEAASSSEPAVVVYPVRTPTALIVFLANLYYERREFEVTIDEATDADGGRIEVFGSDDEVAEHSVRVTGGTTIVRLAIDPWLAVAVTCPLLPSSTIAGSAGARREEATA